MACQLWEHGLHLHVGGQMCTRMLHLIRRCNISDRRRCKISDRRLVEQWLRGRTEEAGQNRWRRLGA